MSPGAARLDVARVRGLFPGLSDGFVHADGPAGSLVPESVLRAVTQAMRVPIANRGGVFPSSARAEQLVSGARSAVADLVGGVPQGVVLGPNMTSLTYTMARTLAKTWRPGDEVVVSRLDHDANVRPWVLAAAAAGATVRWVDFDPVTSELPVAAVAAQLTDRTRLVAVTAASNLIGTMPDVRAIAELTHAAGALLYVDGVHYTAHGVVDVREFGADFFACSPYKFLGPHCGVVAGRADVLAELRPAKLLPSPDRVPERFELGTLPYEVMAGATAAVDFLADMTNAAGSRRERLVASLEALEVHEDGLRQRIELGLEELAGVRIHSTASRRTPTLLVTFDGRDAAEISAVLAEHDVNAPAGSFYAYEAARLLGLGDAGGLRIGLAPYNTAADVDRLLRVLGDALR